MKPLKSWMIYGANGYSAKIIADEAKKRGYTPILAGRNSDKVKAVAEKLDLPYRAFDLSNMANVVDNLSDIDLVLHCAGPFSATSKPMIDGCLQAQCHYLDITGEISVFEHVHSPKIDRAAKEKEIVVCSGVGFDIIPTDCLARSLSEAMPDATSLSLAFTGETSVSPGTAKTVVEGLATGNKVRRNGVIVNNKAEKRIIEFASGTETSASITWGDVSSAFYSTGIKNITVYIPMPAALIQLRRLAEGFLSRLLRIQSLQNFVKRQIDKYVEGPSESVRQQSRIYLWGEVSNDKGQRKTGYLETSHTYDVTIHGPLAIIEHLLDLKNTNENPPLSGSLTPSLLMGSDFVSRLPGASAITIK